MRFRGGGGFNGSGRCGSGLLVSCRGVRSGRLHGRFRRHLLRCRIFLSRSGLHRCRHGHRSASRRIVRHRSRINQHQERQDKQGASGEGAVERLPEDDAEQNEPAGLHQCRGQCQRRGLQGGKRRGEFAEEQRIDVRCGEEEAEGNQEDCQQEEKAAAAARGKVQYALSGQDGQRRQEGHQQHGHVRAKQGEDRKRHDGAAPQPALSGALLAVDHDTLEEGTDPSPGKEQQEQRPGKPEDGKQGHDDP